VSGDLIERIVDRMTPGVHRGSSSAAGLRAGPLANNLANDVGLRRQARRYAALGEPVRLAMVKRLLLTDASPGELGAACGLATNLLAHHLKVLQVAGLVRRVRSEGDARRAYVQLCLEDHEVMALLAQRSDPTPVSAIAPRRVLFVCTHNSARSQLAAAAWQRASQLPVASAGTHPAVRVHPRAVTVGRRHGLLLAPGLTTWLADIVTHTDLLVCVCDNVYEELAGGCAPSDVPVVGKMHWAVPDPVRVDTDEAFEAAYTQIVGRVGRLADALGPL
jgi:protein-tyrosine-phosphatase/DNA-binding transcriptional ArsR family regulator